MSEQRTERLFSYGTLQQESVQLANFGRKLNGSSDAVLGYELTSVKINDPIVIAESGLTEHSIIVPCGNPRHEVEGVVFAITAAELQAADDYETSDYKRVRVILRSGTEAWVYVSAQLI